MYPLGDCVATVVSIVLNLATVGGNSTEFPRISSLFRALPSLSCAFPKLLNRFYAFPCPNFIGCTASSHPVVCYRSFCSCLRLFDRVWAHVFAHFFGRSCCTSIWRLRLFYVIFQWLLWHLRIDISSGYVRFPTVGPGTSSKSLMLSWYFQRNTAVLHGLLHIFSLMVVPFSFHFIVVRR